ncbi:class I SAM-dependent methyltransferase [Actinosynnema sp. NPDC020468]|uniref:class I SAM-dependent methyltransferase n=1 Tax=Actinosynnema sp. NPDC020468 TaxID=3154488 RepID=UPI0033E6B16E
MDDAVALSQRLFQAGLACAELMSCYLGTRLGLYEHLRDDPATPDGLAERAGVDARYAREWLEQQAVAGILTVREGVYALPPGHAAALTDPDSPTSVAALALLPVGGIAAALPDLVEAFRTGGGVDSFGEAADRGGFNRAVFRHDLPGWLRSGLPGLHRRLREHGGRIADLACGAGWSTAALAEEFPLAVVHGFDLDPGAVAAATATARARGVADRVRVRVRDVADPVPERYDLVCLFDALHDMPHPVEVLRACRALRTDRGAVLLMEPRAAHAFTAPGDEVERFLYAVSVLHCLPAGMRTRPSAATGAVLRPDRLREYARQAGFSDVEVLPARHRFHRLYLAVG